MLSNNPHSGINEADISNTLDVVSCGSPTSNQGGVIIVRINDDNVGKSP